MKEYNVNERIKVIEDPDTGRVVVLYKGMIILNQQINTTGVRFNLVQILKERLEPSPNPDAYLTPKEVQDTLGLHECGIAQIGIAMSKAGFTSEVSWVNNKSMRVYKGVQCKKLY